MSEVTFANGQIFRSTALDPDSVNRVFQLLIVQMIGNAVGGSGDVVAGEVAAGDDPSTASSANPYAQVRIDWQQEGQPAWGIEENICFIRSTPLDEDFSQVRDEISQPIIQPAPTMGVSGEFVGSAGDFAAGEGFVGGAPGESIDRTAIALQSGFTQVWAVHCTFYGRNGYDLARLVISCMSLDWVGEQLAAANLYPVPTWKRPTYAGELFQGQWWKRTDMELHFNEQVTETIPVDAAASVDVEIVTDGDANYTTKFTIRAS